MIRDIFAALGLIWTVVILFWLGVMAYVLRRDRLAREAKHADVDALAQRAKHLSSRRARVEQWHDIPTADELGI